jgi:glycosyltransferase involved in cell wall biosynthesis
VLLLSQQERTAWAAFEPGVRFEVVLNPFVPPQEEAYSVYHQNAPGDDPGESLVHLRTSSPTVLFVGRLMAEKGIFDLLEAMRQLASKGTHVALVVAGDGPSAAEVRAKSAALGLERQIDMRGYLSGAALRAAYAEADIFALPTYWAEGFPTVIMEAMHAGLPIVTTPLRGAVDQLVQGKHSLFVPPHRPDLLAAALERLAGDEPLRLLMGSDNRLKVKDFAPEKVARRYLEILREVVDIRAAGQCLGAGQ